MRHWNNGTDHRHSKSCCDKSSPARRTIMRGIFALLLESIILHHWLLVTCHNEPEPDRNCLDAISIGTIPFRFGTLRQVYMVSVSVCCYQGNFITATLSRKHICSIHRIMHTVRAWGRFKNMHELLNLRALKFSHVNKIHIFQCMGKIFCVKFQRYPLKFHTKYLTHTLKDMIFIRHWNFKSSYI